MASLASRRFKLRCVVAVGCWVLAACVVDPVDRLSTVEVCCVSFVVCVSACTESSRIVLSCSAHEWVSPVEKRVPYVYVCVACALVTVLVSVSYTHLTLPTIYSV